MLHLELFFMTKQNSRNFETITELKTILLVIYKNNTMYFLVKKISVNRENIWQIESQILP